MRDPGPAARRRRRGASPVRDGELARLADAVRRSRGLAIDGYAPEFVEGVVAAAISRENVGDASALAERIRADPACGDRLLRSLWVGTTSLFRDPIVFRAIRREVVPTLRKARFARIWVAGCSTGEEVYSLAILLRDEGLLDRCRIYATDVNARALDVARLATYPATVIRDGIPRYHASGGRGTLCEIYTARRGRVTFAPSLAVNVVFAVHDLAARSRFQDFDLILCRNVMIWFGSKLRDDALALLRASLRPGGTLVLGRRENPNDGADLPPFDRVVAGTSMWRLPLRNEAGRRTTAVDRRPRHEGGTPDASTPRAASKSEAIRLPRVMERHLASS